MVTIAPGKEYSAPFRIGYKYLFFYRKGLPDNDQPKAGGQKLF